MGISSSVEVCMGVRMRDLVHTEEVTQTSTKYDPDTGKPYEVHLKQIRRMLFNLMLPESGDDKWYEFKEVGGLIEGLKMFTSKELDRMDADDTIDRSVIGVELCKFDSYYDHSAEHPWVIPISTADMTRAREDVLRILGVRGYIGPVDVFLVASCSD